MHELNKLAAEKKKRKRKKRKKGSLGKALAIGAGTSMAVGSAKGAIEKTIERRLSKRIKSPTARWALARGVPSAAASVAYTLATLKAVEAARGKK